MSLTQFFIPNGIENNSAIDRVQLYSEIKFHIVALDERFFVENANPIDLTITSSGDVVDTRIGIVAKGLYGDEYYE